MINEKWMSLAVLILGALALSGCAELNSDFDCPRKPGVSCESLDKVNDRVDRVELSKSKIPRYTRTEYKSPSSNYDKSSIIPLRNHEAFMPIWIGPYEDTKGNYHEGSMIYTTVNDSDMDGLTV